MNLDLEHTANRINEQDIARKANYQYYSNNKELLREKYGKEIVLIYNEKVIANSNSTEEICKKWFDLVDEEHRFHVVIAQIPEVSGVFI